MRTAIRSFCLLPVCFALLIALTDKAAAQPTNSAQPIWCGLQAVYGDYHARIGPPPHFGMKPPTATILVTYTGFTAPAESAFAYAASIWASTITSAVPIRINAKFVPLQPGILGGAFANFPDTLFDGRWLASALGDAITGRDLEPGYFDIDLFLSSNVAAWYFGTDGNPASNQVDFVTVALHEICHGLGFVSLCKVESGLGSYSMVTQNEIPVPLSFPWPDFAGRQNQFVRYVENGSGQLFTDTTLFANPSTALAAQFTSDDVFFNGPNAVLGNSGTRPKLYAELPFRNGSSISHLDQNTYPPGTTNGLMTPIIVLGTSNHSPGPIVLGMCKDLGWRVDSTTVGIAEEGVNAPNNFALAQNYPNPFNPSTAISFALPSQSFVSIKVFDLVGREVTTIVSEELPAGSYTKQWDASGLSSGAYFYRMQAGSFMETRKLLLLR